VTALNKPKREEVELAWKALHMQPGEPDKKHHSRFCRCDVDVGAVPCDYCALHQGLRCADALLDENEQLKLRLKTFDDERKRLRIVEEEIERLKERLQNLNLGEGD
jgi:hypothetical protein